MSIPSFSLEGKVAIVTGGRRGIGRAIALGFAEAGADVAVCDCVVEDGELGAVAEEIQRLGRRSLAVQTDVSRKSEVDNLVERVTEQFGAIDILVNNAGIVTAGPLVDISEDEWDRTIDVNLKGCHLCSQAAGKRMIERKRGNIINIASQFGMRAAIERGPYCASKAGVILLTRVLAIELVGYNIRVNAIAPGAVKTPASWRWWSDPETLKQYEATIPMGRMAEPSEIVGAALFLASDASSYVTGHTLLVDGGMEA